MTSKSKILGFRVPFISRAEGLLRGASKLRGIVEASTVALIATVGLAVYDFIIPLFTENYTQNLAAIGAVISAGYIIGFLSEIPVGKLADRWGRIKVLLVAFILMGLLSVLFFFFAHNILYIALLVLGFGFAQIMFWVPSTVLIRDLSPKGLLSQSQGIYLTLSQFGWIAGPLIAGLITGWYSDRHNFLISAIFLFAALFVTIIIFRKYKKKTSILKKAEHKARLTFLVDSFKTYIRAHKHAPPLYLLSFISYVWIATEWTFAALAGIMVFGFSETVAGVVLSAMMIVEAALFYSAGYLMDKIGKRYIITGGLLLLFASAYFAFFSSNPAMFVFFLLLSAGATSWILPGTEAILTEIMPASVMGEMSGVFDTSKDLGLIVGPFVGGLLAELLLGPLTPFLFVAVMAGIGALIAGFVFWPEYNKPKKKEAKR